MDFQTEARHARTAGTVKGLGRAALPLEGPRPSIVTVVNGMKLQLDRFSAQVDQSTEFLRHAGRHMRDVGDAMQRGVETAARKMALAEQRRLEEILAPTNVNCRCTVEERPGGPTMWSPWKSPEPSWAYRNRMRNGLAFYPNLCLLRGDIAPGMMQIRMEGTALMPDQGELEMELQLAERLAVGSNWKPAFQRIRGWDGIGMGWDGIRIALDCLRRHLNPGMATPSMKVWARKAGHRDNDWHLVTEVRLTGRSPS